jgi:ribosomal peptide maturation radical SAM protein 1
VNETELILVSMPWASVHRTPIQVGILRSAVEKAGFRVTTRSFFLAAIEYFSSATANLSSGERITVADYDVISDTSWRVGMGDWIFVVPPYCAPDVDLDEEYFAYLRSHEVSEQLISKAVQLRALVPSFLQMCVEDILAASPRIVGFTSSFSQNVPSLVLSKMLKERDPSIHIVFGGANCDGSMGVALHRTFHWIDTVVCGKGEHALVELVHNIVSGEPIKPQPGLCYRQDGESIVVASAHAREIAMDEVPTPNYDEYFDRLRKSHLYHELAPKITVMFESARGCWWGEKMHCTFCGLNGSTMAFQSKSPRLVADEIYSLASRYQQVNFEAVDNIIDLNYMEELLPQLRDYRRTGLDINFFYETKANLKKKYVRLMRDAGIHRIQPGIESLSSSVLKLMRKGVTALQNIRLLKWAKQFNLKVHWNLLYGTPGETLEEYERMASVMQSLTHLQPPSTGQMVIERFSPYHQNPSAFGLTDVKPCAFYKFLYGDEAPLNDLAYDFSHKYADDRDPARYLSIVKSVVERWREGFDQGINSLTYKRGPNFLVISDRRSNLKACDYYLEQTEAAIYLCCDAGTTPRSILEYLRRNGVMSRSLADVKEFLDSLTEARLLYEEAGQYLSLALPINSDADDFNFDSTETEVPRASVELSPLTRRILVA